MKIFKGSSGLVKSLKSETDDGLSSCSNFPERPTLDEMQRDKPVLPEIEQLRSKITDEQLEAIKDVLERFFMVWSLQEGRSADPSRRTKAKPGGVLRLSSGFSLGYAAESNTPSKPAGGVADHRKRNKAITGQRHALAAIRLGLLHDVEKNPGPSKTWKCTKCRKGITRKTWSVKYNGCSEWIHWDAQN